MSKSQVRHNREEWVAHYEGWRVSGKTQRGYCGDHGIELRQFKDQISEARRAGAIPPSKQDINASRAGFVPVQIRQSASGEHEVIPYCEIRFFGKPSIQIDSEDSLANLKQLIESLR
jgi:hypothetical protein